MPMQDQPIVIGANGLRGRLVGREGDPDAGGRLVIELDQGGRLLVAPDLLTRSEDGTYHLPLSPEELPTGAPGEPAPAERVIPLAEEVVRVDRVAHESKVRVRIGVEEREEVVDVPLTEETVSVERVPINRIVDGPLSVREEGDAIVIPLLEEVVSVEKKLMLREEVRIVRRSEEVRRPQHVTLRREEAQVERVDQPDRPSPAEPGRDEAPR